MSPGQTHQRRWSSAFRAAAPLKAALITLTVAAMAPLPAMPAPGAQLTSARELYSTIIGFQTSAGLGQVPKMADYLAGRFRAAGFEEKDIHILPFADTASLVVRY